MRNLLGIAGICSALLLAGCGDLRSNMLVVPDRAGHAAGDPDMNQVAQVNRPMPNEKTEMWITMGAGDTLYTIAKAYNVTLEWLIKRNQIVDAPKAGTNLIVPKNATPPKK